MIKKWNPCPECGAEMEDIPVFLDERKLVGKIMCRCPKCYKIYEPLKKQPGETVFDRRIV